jgi:hypothetical protein
MAKASIQHPIGRGATAGIWGVGVQHAPDVRVVGVHRGVHRDRRALDGGEVTLDQGAVQPEAHHRRARVVAQRGPGGVVELIAPWDPDAHVAVIVGSDRPAGRHTRPRVEQLIHQILVHRASSFCPRPAG